MARLIVFLELVDLSKLTPEMLQKIEDRLQENDEVTSMQLQKLLKDRGHNKLRSTVIKS